MVLEEYDGKNGFEGFADLKKLEECFVANTYSILFRSNREIPKLSYLAQPTNRSANSMEWCFTFPSRRRLRKKHTRMDMDDSRGGKECEPFCRAE